VGRDRIADPGEVISARQGAGTRSSKEPPGKVTTVTVDIQFTMSLY